MNCIIGPAPSPLSFATANEWDFPHLNNCSRGSICKNKLGDHDYPLLDSITNKEDAINFSMVGFQYYEALDKLNATIYFFLLTVLHFRIVITNGAYHGAYNPSWTPN